MKRTREDIFMSEPTYVCNLKYRGPVNADEAAFLVWADEQVDNFEDLGEMMTLMWDDSHVRKYKAALYGSTAELPALYVDALILVFQWLDFSSLFQCARTCRLFRRAAQSDRLAHLRTIGAWSDMVYEDQTYGTLYMQTPLWKLEQTRGEVPEALRLFYYFVQARQVEHLLLVRSVPEPDTSFFVVEDDPSSESSSDVEIFGEFTKC